MKSKPYLYFPTPVVDHKVAFCVESCPLYTGSYIYLYDNDWNNTRLKMFNYTQQQTKAFGKFCLPFEIVARTAIEKYFGT